MRHISTYKHRWVRRIVIILVIPYELIRSTSLAAFGTLKMAKIWWSVQ